MKSEYEKYIIDGKCILPDSITEIERCAFYSCIRLTSIEIPNNVTEIGTLAFRGCTGLTSIEIPDSVTEIEDSAFDGCTRLKSIILNITNKIPAYSETFIENVLRKLRNSQVKLTVNIPIGTVYAYRHYPHFDQDRLEFIPCIRPKRID